MYLFIHHFTIQDFEGVEMNPLVERGWRNGWWGRWLDGGLLAKVARARLDDCAS